SVLDALRPLHPNRYRTAARAFGGTLAYASASWYGFERRLTRGAPRLALAGAARASA
ncbi:acyltransferase, partial [Burkholderia pseudomallei]